MPRRRAALVGAALLCAALGAAAGARAAGEGAPPGAAAAADAAWPPWLTPFDPDVHGVYTRFEEGAAVGEARDLLLHRDRFFALAPPAADLAAAARRAAALSLNAPAFVLPAPDARAFARNLVTARVAGACLWLDYPFPEAPDHLGHWLETLAPLVSALAADGALHADWVVLPSLQRAELASAPWARELLAAALAPALGEGGLAEERLITLDDLEAASAPRWLSFERVVHAYTRNDRPSEEEAGAPQAGFGFAAHAHAAALRAAVAAAAGVAERAPGAPGPPLATLLLPADGQPLANSRAALAAVRAGAAAAGLVARPYSASAGVSLAALAAIAARSTLLVSRASPLLAVAALLPPGSAVVELLPHNWAPGGAAERLRNLTRSAGGIAHVAWRAPGAEAMDFASPADARYAGWTAEECSGSAPCLAAHDRAALRVDAAALEALVADVGAAAARGEAPAAVEARHPFPRAALAAAESTGLWWDVR
jgi:hypothetical protein